MKVRKGQSPDIGRENSGGGRTERGTSRAELLRGKEAGSSELARVCGIGKKGFYLARGG